MISEDASGHVRECSQYSGEIRTVARYPDPVCECIGKEATYAYNTYICVICDMAKEKKKRVGATLG